MLGLGGVKERIEKNREIIAIIGRREDGDSWIDFRAGLGRLEGMVNRILSLQLVFTLAASQAWAISGGPYDGQLRLASMSGTYGVSLNGANDDHLSTTGVMLLSVPTRGLAVAKTLIFDQGLMYAGTSTGAVKLSDGLDVLF